MIVKYSILIPVYNVEDYIRNCLDSLLAQSYDNYEIICVNDGSMDASGKICDEYAKQFPNIIKVIHKHNQGLISARRVGIQAASGEYICFVDSDDSVTTNYLETINANIKLYQPDILIFGLIRTNQEGVFLYASPPSLNDGFYSNDNFKQITDQVILTYNLNSLCTKCVKSEIIDRNTDYSKYYNVQNEEDLLQSLPMIDQSKEILIINDCLYYYRTNFDSLTQTKITSSKIDSWLSVHASVCEYAEKWGYPKKIYTQRFGLILTNIIPSLVINRVKIKTYNKDEINILFNRTLENDFQLALNSYRPSNLFSLSNFYRLVFHTKSRFVFRISLVLLEKGYRLRAKLFLRR